MADELHIEVCYARRDAQFSYPLTVAEGVTIGEAIRLSGILDECPEIDLQHQRVGVFSELRSLDEAVHQGDRIEIYRPLIADPKESRRARARKHQDNRK